MKRSIKELEELLYSANEAYYQEKREEFISDLEYDLALEELRELMPNHELVINHLNRNIEESLKVKLPIKMGSLRKALTFKDFLNWCKTNKVDEKTIFIITPKLNGIAFLSNEVENRAYTRGDGDFGLNVSKHYSKMNLKEKGLNSCYYIGEAILSNSLFKNKYKDKFANPRSVVSGIFNTLNPDEEILKDISFLKYDIREYGQETFLNKGIIMSFCNNSNTSHLPFYTIPLSQLTEEILDKLFEEYSKNLDFELDGLVIDIDSKELRKSLGYDGIYPKFAIAYKPYKYNPDCQYTKIEKIHYQISRYGKLAPVAQIKPVILNGAEVSRVSLYNIKYLIDNNICIGKEGYVFRAGFINPKFLSFFHKEEEKIDFPNYCPSCGEALKITEVDLVCTSDKCFEKDIKKISYFFEAIGVKEFKEKSVTSLYLSGFDSILKILTIEYDELIRIEGFASTGAKTLIKQFDKIISEGIELEKLQDASSCFEGIGEKTFKKLNTVKVDLEYLYKDSYYNSIFKQLTNLEEVGPETASIFLNKIYEFQKFLLSLPIKIKKITNKPFNLSSEILKDYIILFSGVRDKELENFIKDNGGEVVTSFSSKVTLLIKEGNEETSKSIKAKEKNVKILSIVEFKQLCIDLQSNLS